MREEKATTLLILLTALSQGYNTETQDAETPYAETQDAGTQYAETQGAGLPSTSSAAPLNPIVYRIRDDVAWENIARKPSPPFSSPPSPTPGILLDVLNNILI